MSKTFKKVPKKRRFDDFDERDYENRRDRNQIKNFLQKRQERAIKTKDIDALMQMDED